MQNRKPMGIMASFSKVVFKKDGREVFTAEVVSGGCFGPISDVAVINEGYAELQRAIRDGKLPTAANDFNAVSVRGHEYAVNGKDPAGIKPGQLKLIK